MVMHKLMRMEEIHENLFIIHKAARDKRVWKIIISHSIIVDSKHLVDLNLIILDILLDPRLSAERPEPKLTIINIDYRKAITLGILLYLFDLDIASLNLLLK